MTEEQIETLKTLDREMSIMLGRLEDFGVMIDAEDKHPIWQIQQPLSTAQSRLERYLFEEAK